MKPSKELSIGLLQTLLGKPPRLLEVVEEVLRGSAISLESLSQEYGFRMMFINLRDAKSYEELDNLVYGILRSELGEVLKLLPPGYVDFAKIFLEIENIEYLCAAASSKNWRYLKHSLSSIEIEGSFQEASQISKLSDYGGCEGTDLACFYAKYLDRVKRVLDTVGEDYSKAYEVVKSLAILHYYRYLRNSELIGLSSNSIEKFMELVKPDPLTEIALRKGISYLNRLDKESLARYTLHEALVTVGIARELLAHGEELINLLVLFLTTRYYETKVLKYTFLPKALRRW